MQKAVQPFLQRITLPVTGSHKGQNGKLMIIGGSELFHAASKWSLDVASKFVDMVFYSSVPSNNELIKEAKGQFWNGIVVRREEVEEYITEADCVLIGPGMERSEETKKIVDQLLKKYPHKKWVIDAGALQMVEPTLLNQHMIITPHLKEWQQLAAKVNELRGAQRAILTQADSNALKGATILLKGPVDQVANTEVHVSIEGGNPGMTKGGTGDVLAGLVAALYCTHDATTAAVVGSYINKTTAERLAKNVGPFFNATALVEEIPQTLWQALTDTAASSAKV